MPDSIVQGESLKPIAPAIPYSSRPSSSSIVEEVVAWFKFGLKVIPTVPGTKATAVKWDPWLAVLSPVTIAAHWVNQPTHEVGFIVGDQFIVLDADSDASTAALIEIEKTFGVTPSMVVQTAKGVHHYFRLAAGTYARSDSHSTTDHPERIDVKTGRTLVILPPSTGKVIVRCDAKTSVELTEVGQGFIDAVFKHNGKLPPRPPVPVSIEIQEPSGYHLRLLEALLRHVSADCGYDDWIHVGMAMHTETAGADEGLDLFDSWSGTGKKYQGVKETETKWRSFRSGRKHSYTIRTLFWMAAQEGTSAAMIYDEVAPFDVVED